MISCMLCQEDKENNGLVDSIVVIYEVVQNFNYQEIKLKNCNVIMGVS